MSVDVSEQDELSPAILEDKTIVCCWISENCDSSARGITCVPLNAVDRKSLIYVMDSFYGAVLALDKEFVRPLDVGIVHFDGFHDVDKSDDFAALLSLSDYFWCIVKHGMIKKQMPYIEKAYQASWSRDTIAIAKCYSHYEKRTPFNKQVTKPCLRVDDLIATWGTMPRNQIIRGLGAMNSDPDYIRSLNNRIDITQRASPPLYRTSITGRQVCVTPKGDEAKKRRARSSEYKRLWQQHLPLPTR